MAREFPFSTVGTTTTNGVEYSYTDNINNLLSSGALPFANYPQNLFWGGIDKNDASFMYPSVAEYSLDSETITMKNLFNASLDDRTFPTSQLSYCYTQPSGLMGYVTNYNIDDGNLNYDTYRNVSNFTGNAGGTKFVSKISLCKAIFSAYVLYYEKSAWNNNSVSFDSPKSTSIKQFEIWEQDGTADGLIIVGFSASNSRGETGYITDNNTVYMNGYQSSSGTPINAIMGNLWKNPFQYADSEYTGFSIPIQSSGQNREHYMPTSGGLGYYATTYNRDLYGDENNALGCPFNGDFTFDISPILAIDTKNTTYKIPYNDGDEYICGGTTSGEFYWSSVRFNGRIYRVYKNIDDLLKYIMGFGMAFYGGAVSRYSHTEGSIIDNYVFAPVLDEHNIYRGEYTRGLKNAANDFFERIDSTDTDYEPSDDPPSPGGDDVAESGDNIDFTNVGTVGSANGFITLYGMNSSAIQEIGQVLWSSVFEGEYWKNILFVLTQSLDSGTIDVSEIIKFFISLKVFPFDLGIYRPGKNTIKFGTGISSLQLSSEVFPITNYTRELDAGMVHIPYIFNDFRDYTNCTISLFLPFCGSIQLNPMDVMGGDIYVKYLVDLTSGACTANVKLIRESHYYPIAMVSGQCASEVPITSTNAGRVISSQVGKMLNFVGEAHDWITDKAKQAAEVVLSGESGGGISPSAMDTDFKGVPFEVAKHVNNAYSAKAIVPYMISGTSGFTGFSAPNQCYVQIKFNHYANPNNYNRTVGQVTVKEKRVSECTGFTVCKNVETAGLTCSSEEKSMIKAILQNGFYA